MKTGSSFNDARTGTAIFVLFSVFVRTAAQAPCRDHFTSDTANIQGIDTIVSVRFNDYSETTAVTSQLITIAWDENVTATLPTDATFLQYFDIDTSVADQWTITLQESLEGLPDYPDVLTNLVAEATFDGFSDYPSDSCTFTIQVFLKDENTQIPEFEQPSYAVDILENYLVGFDIGNLDVRVRDNDGGPPNSDITVSADSRCPLEPVTPDQSGFQGQFKRVDMKLKDSLDYESQKTFICTITAMDKGAGFLSKEVALTITVINMPDEPPVFEHEYYSATLASNLGGTHLDILPNPISATDGDQGTTKITYDLSDGKPGVVGTDYFHINPDTGAVTLTMELDDTMLLNEKLLFFVTATDESLDFSKAVLEVTLPPAPTTNPSGGGDTTGLKVAVGILGALLGLVLIVAGFLMYKQHRSKAQRQRKISTVGGAYPNLGYDTDKMSANHVGDADRDSPPHFRSSLANTKDSTATESIGIRRTDPGTPELHSKSSRAPSPIYENIIDINSIGRPAASSVSSSVAEIPFLYPSLTTTPEDKPYLSSYGQKNEKSPPPLNSTPARSILRGASGSQNHEAYPLTDVSVQKNVPAKPEGPETNYDKENEMATSTFGGLKSSPILKRASVVVMNSDHKDGNKSIKSYSSLDAKKSNLKHEKSDSDGEEEERKSVAFKVLVDTKTIEPENMGPAQRAAAQADAQSDALDILEANKKKMEDSSSEGEDDDEENNVRL